MDAPLHALVGQPFVRLRDGLLTKPTNDDLIVGHTLIRFTEEDDIDAKQIAVNMLRESINITVQQRLSTFRIPVMTPNDCCSVD